MNGQSISDIADKLNSLFRQLQETIVKSSGMNEEISAVAAPTFQQKECL